MDRTQGGQKPYPTGYEHIAAHVRKAQDRIRHLDEQIQNVPHDRPELTLTPPGLPKLRHFGNRERQVSYFRQLQEDIRKETFSDIEKALAAVDLELGQIVKGRAIEDLYANPYENMVPNQRSPQKEGWDIDQAQERLTTFFNRNDQQEPTKQQIDRLPQSMSARFLQSLHYTKAYDKTGAEPDKSPEPDIEPDKD